ncbi:PQQ-dependent sugar dehydrogenase [Haloferula sp. BvORR071]|uniref:PQQ-dependent sugar dehydrogenase n=1 Tax=Haloferula sp. BvORR071 TaxID=1396141 RepID=UPI000554D2DB|nr:PQQ-dependent sugar dehydrogenase [Haloferula sp. BvORR071]
MRRPPLVAFLLPCVLASAFADPAPLRQPNPALNVPATPPVDSTSFALVNAFPNLSFSEPVCLVSPPGDTHRLFICEQGGKIWMIPDTAAASPTKVLFLDLLATVNARTGERLRTNGDEIGLLGMAFHPQYASNRYFYLAYSVGLGSGNAPPLHDRLCRFTTQAANPNLADTTSELVYIDQRDQQGNHNGGDLHFGPDGYLYFSVGDEGGQNDQQLNAQIIDRDFFSAIFRIDVDKKPGNLEPNPNPNPAYADSTGSSIKRDNGIARYSVPADNPFVGATTFNGLPVNPDYVRGEMWAVGLRNPWRFSFDPMTNNLWCGDVGGSKREEVNLIVKGGNYGWVYREGPFEGPWDVAAHPAAPPGFTSIDPVYNYHHSQGGADFTGDCIIGGLVCRGGSASSLYGKYLFADYTEGKVWSMNQDGTGVTKIFSEGGISAFGTDPSNQDVLLADEDGGRLLRITGNVSATAFPNTLSETGLFTNVASLTPAPGVVPYEVNLPFWSDHAQKQRWFTVPSPTATFTGSQDGLWTLPTGTIWVKHFDMEMQRGVPASKKRIETRLIVKNAAGAYGVSYRWNAGGTEATLVPDGGDSFNLAITDNGNPVPQTWTIPARGQCMICHTSQAGYALSFNTRQLNLENDMSGHAGNQLTTLFTEGYLSGDPGSPNLLPRHLRPDESTYSIEARVRSYLAVNCSYCHKTGGTALGQWDGRPELTLDQTNLVNGPATNNGGNEANKLVVPGDTTHSIVLNRVAVTNGFTRMPPLASNVLDTAAANLLTTWINGELENRQTYEAWRISNFEPDGDPAGAPAVDADGDKQTNYQEFLAGTDPNAATSHLLPQVNAANGAYTLSFNLPANRSFRITSTPDLTQAWTPWDIPGNQPLPHAAGLVEFTFPITTPERYFRVELQEH